MSAKDKHVDVVVVGAGAGGGVVAKELATNGFQVALLERGRWVRYGVGSNDEMTSMRGPMKRSMGPDLEKNPRVRIEGEGADMKSYPMNGYSSHIASCVGSGTVSYGAMAWRFMEEDFKMESTYGKVEGSTLADWPISYDDLEPYYEKAEWEIGVSGDGDENPFSPPRRKGYPMPAFEQNDDGKVLAEACKRLGLNPFSIPMARNSVPYNGRPGCIRNRTCAGYACPVSAKNGTHNTVIPKAIASGNCDLRVGCQVVEVMVDDDGHARGVRYFDAENVERIQTADIVVVASSATETARLLLNSKSKKFPDGAGNNNDWVGRNLQGHAYTGANGFFPDEVHRFSGPGATLAICDYNHHNPGIIGGGLLANEFYKLPYQFSKMRPPKAARWGLEHKKFQRENFRKFAQVLGPIQEMPNFHSRVIAYEGKKDFWGSPVVGLSGSRHPLDRKHCKFLAEKAEEILKEAGATTTWQNVGGRGQGSGVHQVGTCRMGDDPSISVTNRYGQVHDIDNLFVADGSTFPTNAGFNPSLTILAVGYWIGEYMVNKYS
ncbi:MAG: GMC family oxidoreductase [Verrucomicrobiota bacterium]